MPPLEKGKATLSVTDLARIHVIQVNHQGVTFLKTGCREFQQMFGDRSATGAAGKNIQERCRQRCEITDRRPQLVGTPDERSHKFVGHY